MHDTYETPLGKRYASKEMLYLFSDDNRFKLWRKLWIALARSEQKLGLPISDAQIAELEAHAGDIDYQAAARYESQLRHDVMAHIHAYGDQCPLAGPILHLGATSCYVGDNAEVLIMRDAVKLLLDKLLEVIDNLSEFAERYKALPTLGFTHFQPAQPTTVGKRAAMWAYDFVLDADELKHRLDTLRLLGSKGTTGTQASFLELFQGDHGKVAKLEELISAEMGMDGVVPVSGQTYTRKVDSMVLNALSGIAQSASKLATDLRLLANRKEIEEPFESGQVGSSAMPYKRNPMRCERICALSRFVIAAALNPAMTAASQWLERTLDDSANRRLAISESFLATDAILELCVNVTGGLVVHERVIESNLMAELPFMAAENILMDAVRRGGDRQALHERIRIHSLAAGQTVKESGMPNDLLERIAGDSEFELSLAELESMLKPDAFVGRAPGQVEDFLKDVVKPLLSSYPERRKRKNSVIMV